MDKTSSKNAYPCDALDFLSETFLFRGIPKEKSLKRIEQINVEKRCFAADETIFRPDSYQKKIGFVLSGECYVERKKCDGTSIPLNLLKKGDSFGILALFSEVDEFPTSIRAKKASCVVFIPQEDLQSLIRKDSEIAINVIKFMSGRISFLNSKLTTFSSDNVCQRLAHFIFTEYKRTGETVFPINCKRTSEALNVGRASLYRNLEDLAHEGIIKFENKKIYITDLEGLERITK